MQARTNIPELLPDLFKLVLAVRGGVTKSGIDSRLLHLIDIRTSQINGCAYCVDMHVREALADGLDPQMLHLIATWRESPFFDDRDRALLQWCESVSLLAETRVPDEDWKALRLHFTEAEAGRLTLAVACMNMLNRVAVSSRTQHPVGDRQAAA